MLREIIIGGSLLAAAQQSKALDIACPDKIVTSQNLAEQAPGWKEFVRPNGDPKTIRWSFLAGIDLYYGDPVEIMQLKPDSEDATEASWTFTRPSLPTRPLYMACSYRGTRIQITRALPLDVKKCTVKTGGVLRCEQFAP
jgi:hypothetical protein